MSVMLCFEKAVAPPPRVRNTSWSVIVHLRWPKFVGDTFTSPNIHDDMP